MTLIIEIKKYMEEFLARSKILTLPAPEQVLPHIGVVIPSTQFLEFQGNAEATIGITIPEHNLIVSSNVIPFSGIDQNLDSQHEVGSTYGITPYEPPASETVILVILKTLEELKKENELVRTRLDRQVETNN